MSPVCHSVLSYSCWHLHPLMSVRHSGRNVYLQKVWCTPETESVDGNTTSPCKTEDRKSWKLLSTLPTDWCSPDVGGRTPPANSFPLEYERWRNCQRTLTSGHHIFIEREIKSLQSPPDYVCSEKRFLLVLGANSDVFVCVSVCQPTSRCGLKKENKVKTHKERKIILPSFCLL